MKNKLKISILIYLMITGEIVFSQTSSLVSLGIDNKLVYTSDTKGNKIPDFSGVGYMNSESPIPYVAVIRTVYPVAGDNLLNVQNAINDLAALPLDANGFRGSILFKAGKYLISDTVKIAASGIVLRGEGTDSATGTHFIGTKNSQYSLFYFSGNGSVNYSTSSRKSIVDPYVPFGTKQLTLAAGHNFIVGDKVVIHRIPKDSWVHLLRMDSLNFLDPTSVSWTASAYDLYSERKVTAVNGNIISIDAPIMDLIDTAYATGEVMRYTSSRIEKCGIENMCISSSFASQTDENHGWEAVTFYKIINSWAKNLQVYYFGYSAVHVLDGAAWITIDSCKMYDAKSTVDGGRRYSFNVDGQRTLVQNCTTRNGRHDYVNGSRTCGPVVFYNCTSTLQLNDIGPHHRWSTGILYDNIIGDGRMDVQNRLNSGSGHGWAGGQVMFWNCNGNRMVIQDPEGDHRNWAIGCIFTEITNVGDQTIEPYGIIESRGTRITAIPSLFKQQLTERLEPLKQNQTISFNSLSAKIYGDADFSVSATASSTLSVTFSSADTSIATVINEIIHIKKAGTVQIIASQLGNLYYNPAISVSQTLVINPSAQSISFNAIATKTYGDADFSGNATASSGLSVIYSSSNLSVATIVNNNIHIIGVGTSIVSAVQSGNNNFSSAPTITQTLTVVKANQVISFLAIPTKVIGTADFNPGASINSGLIISYTSSNTAVATIVNGNIHIVSKGTALITAAQSGNSNYNPATNVQQTLTVTGISQTINFPAIPLKVFGNADFAPGATVSSGLTVSYTSSNTSVATIVSGNIHIVAAGTSIITASQSGNTTYNAASSVNQTLTVSPSLNYSPTAITILSGKLSSGVIGNLATNNSSYYVVSSTTSGTRVNDWYGSVKITQSPSSISKLTINYDGKNSISRTQIIYLYNWVTATWTQIDSRSVSSSDILISKIQTSPSNFISTLGEIRARIYSTGGTSNYTSSGDWLQFVLETAIVAKNIPLQIENESAKVNVYPNPTNGFVNVEYSLEEKKEVVILMYNLNGQLVKNCINQIDSKGKHSIRISLENLIPGVYQLHFKTGSQLNIYQIIVSK